MNRLLSSKIFIFLGTIGLSDSIYLTYKHFSNEIIPCTINGCETVLTSKYSEIYGIPTSAFGILFYATVIIASFIYLKSRSEIVYKFTLLTAFFGFITSIGLVYLQIAVIKAICQYCMISAFTSTIIFLLSAQVVLMKKKDKLNEELIES